MELPIVINDAQKPCGGCVVEFPHLFWQPRRCSLCRFTHYRYVNTKVNAVALWAAPFLLTKTAFIGYSTNYRLFL
ncbi:MAG: hypothetical protein LBB89_06165 [Treponema sp.]|nr:hypothetical protein [Treponema sp.]